MHAGTLALLAMVRHWLLDVLLLVQTVACVMSRSAATDHFASAQRAMQMQDFDAAQRALAFAIAGEPNTLRTIAALEASCAVLHSLGRNDEALAACDAARALAPRFGVRAQSAELNRGAVLVALQRHDDAALHLAAVCALQPTHAGARLNLGAALSALGRHNEAAQALFAAHRLQPNQMHAMKALKEGAALENQGHREEAARVVSRAAELLGSTSEAAHKQLANLRLASFRPARIVDEEDVTTQLETTRALLFHNRTTTTHELWSTFGGHPRLRALHVVAGALDAPLCAALVAAAERYAASRGWSRNGHLSRESDAQGVDYRSSMLVAALVPSIRNLLQNAGVFDLMLRLCADLFGLSLSQGGHSDVADELWFGDLFLVRYVEGEAMPKHRDWSELSFVVELSTAEENFSGGGTRFYQSSTSVRRSESDGPAKSTVLYRVPRGGVAFFCGRIPHSADVVTRGKRFVLAGFVRVRMKQSGRMLPSCDVHLPIPTNLNF